MNLSEILRSFKEGLKEKKTFRTPPDSWTPPERATQVGGQPVRPPIFNFKKQHQIFKISFFHKFHLSFEKNSAFHNCLEFSQPPSCFVEAKETRTKSIWHIHTRLFTYVSPAYFFFHKTGNTLYSKHVLFCRGTQYRLIFAPRKVDALKINICPRTSSSRAKMLLLRTSNFRGATIRPIAPRH